MNHDACRAAITKAKADYLENPTCANFKIAKDAATSPREIERRYSTLRSLAREALKKYHRNHVAKPVIEALESAVAAIEREAEKIQANEIAVAEEVGVPHTPSESLMALITRARNLREHAERLRKNPESVASPKTELSEFMTF